MAESLDTETLMFWPVFIYNLFYIFNHVKRFFLGFQMAELDAQQEHQG